MVGTEQPLPVRENLLDQRDRVGDPARRVVGGGEAVARAHGVRMARAEQTLEVRGQGLADRDGARHAVA